jgi:hypothetical protein
MRDDFSTPPGHQNKGNLFERTWLRSPESFQDYVIMVGAEYGLKAAYTRQQAPLVLNNLLSMPHVARIGLPRGSRWEAWRDGDGAMSADGYSLLESHTDPKTWHIELDWWREDFERIADDYILFDRMLHLGFRLQYTQELFSPPDGAFLQIRATAVEQALIQRLRLRYLARPPHVVVKHGGTVGLQHNGAVSVQHSGTADLQHGTDASAPPKARPKKRAVSKRQNQKGGKPHVYMSFARGMLADALKDRKCSLEMATNYLKDTVLPAAREAYPLAEEPSERQLQYWRRREVEVFIENHPMKSMG